MHALSSGKGRMCAVCRPSRTGTARDGQFCKGSHVNGDPGKARTPEEGWTRVLAVMARLAARAAKPRCSGHTGQNRAAVCLLSQTPARDGRGTAVPTHGAGLVVRLLGRGPQAPTVWLQGRPSGPAVRQGLGNLRLAAFGGQTARFWPKGPERPDVCLLSQTPDRNGPYGPVPPSATGSRVVGGVRGVHPPDGR